MTIRDFERYSPGLGRRVYVDPSASVIGEVTLGDDVSVWPGAVLRGDVERIVVGARTNIQDLTVCHVTHDGPYSPYSPGGRHLEIGADVTVGHRVILHACTVGERCLVGMGAVLMDDVIVEDDVMIAAGSLVTPGKRLRAGRLYRGSPAREVRELTREELDNLRYSAEHYVHLKDRHLADQAAR